MLLKVVILSIKAILWVSLEDDGQEVRADAEQLLQEDSTPLAEGAFLCTLAMQICIGGLVFSPSFSETI